MFLLIYLYIYIFIGLFYLSVNVRPEGPQLIATLSKDPAVRIQDAIVSSGFVQLIKDNWPEESRLKQLNPFFLPESSAIIRLGINKSKTRINLYIIIKLYSPFFIFVLLVVSG